MMNVLFFDYKNKYKVFIEEQVFSDIKPINIYYAIKKEEIDFNKIYDYIILNCDEYNINKEIIQKIKRTEVTNIDLISNKDIDRYIDLVDNYVKEFEDRDTMIKNIKNRIKSFYNKYYQLLNKNINLNMLSEKFSFIETDNKFNIIYISSNLLNKIFNKKDYKKPNNLEDILTKEEIEILIKENKTIPKNYNGIDFKIDYIKIDTNHYFIFKEDIKDCLEEIISNHKNYITTEIFAKLSHEIRTPIMAISMFLELLKENLKGNDIIKNIDLCFEEIKCISKMLNYSIDFVKVNNYVDLINIKNIIEQCIYLYRSLYNVIDFNYFENVSQDVILRGNPLHFKNVIINIIKNAVEQIINNNIEKGKIDVYIIIESINDIKLLKIQIIDNGGGLKISKEDIFNLFKTYKKKNGSGIGLVYCKNVIENMGGRITINNYKEGVKVELQFIL